MARDNVRKVELGDREYEIEASLGAGIAYRNEFFGKLDEPYVGSMDDDMLKVWNMSMPTYPAADGDGEVKNEGYEGLDVLALLRITWAMWSAHDPKSTTWKSFSQYALHANVSSYQLSMLYTTVIIELGGGCTFRRPKGPAGAVAADGKQGS